MNETVKDQEENKKRAAYKRFSQMGVAGLAAVSMSMSAFVESSVKQPPAKNENDSKQERCPSSPKFNYAQPFSFDDERFIYADSDTTHYSENPDYGNYSNNQYIDIAYSNHVDYSNNYSDVCD